MLARLAVSVRRLPPASFAFVMATGIVSTAFHIVGRDLISGLLMAIAILALCALVLATLWRLKSYREEIRLDLYEPSRAFGFFTVIAGINVLGIRIYKPDRAGATIALAVTGALIWLIFTYGIPGTLILRARTSPVISEINGSWFLWVVATQSIAAAAAVIGHDRSAEVLASVAVALWGIGVLLYLMLATLITWRLLSKTNEPGAFSPSYWIYMGATAITVLAGTRILAFPHELAIMQATSNFVSGFTYVLWAFGTWWVPLLVIFGFWRHVAKRQSVRYETGLWSIVFPLGMYSTASMLFGRQTRISFITTIGHWGTWIAGAVWLTVTLLMVSKGLRWFSLQGEKAGAL